MTDYDLLLINPSISTNQKIITNVGNIFMPKNFVCRSFNTGLLSIASYVQSKGYQVKIIDLLDKKDNKYLVKNLENEKPLVAAISCQSGFGYPSSLKCAEIIKQISPKTIVIGGGCHLGALGKIVWEDTNAFDLIGQFEGEWLLVELLARLKKNKEYSDLPSLVYKKNHQIIENNFFPQIIDVNIIPNLQFSLYPNYKTFAPFIEESRGCFAECEFCMSKFQYNRQLRIKRPEKIKQEFDNLFSYFGASKTYAVLASTFGVNTLHTIEFTKILKKYDITWTTETRVDAPWKKWLNDAVKSGLKVLNASPESGSPEILLRMKKTTNPKAYLNKTVDLINESNNYDKLILKLNYLFYLGETPTTIKETIDFIVKNGEKIHSLACSPLMIYPGSEASAKFQTFAKEYGSSLISDELWKPLRIYPCNVSKYFSFYEMANLSAVLDKMYNSEEKYYQTMEYKFGTKHKSKVKKSIIESKFGRQN
ncbi:MAG: cobalamin-dependent protein [archaeon]|nr:cobalamin-dependent protein [archaeon]